MSEGSEYRERLAKHILKDVFGDLWFSDETIRNILYDTYIANIPAMNRYAFDTQTDLREYYYEIKRILLQTPDTKLRQKRLEKQR